MTEITAQLSTALADRYQIESHLGEGGMATVYLAHDVKHDRKVALKVLRPELAAVIGAERFLNEIKVTANLQHPHILPLHDSGTVHNAGGGEFLYYVMPYVEGETLRDKIDREKQLAVDEAIGITKAVSSALDYAHRHEVVHRDIKPENILLHDGQALVADFGIALAVSEASGKRLTETGLSIGTPHYMSPEQAMGDRELDARSDVYSLGAMLYEMLAGDPPYTGSTAQAIVAKVITEKAPLVTSARPTVPPNVAAAIEKALEKLPADRFTSAARFSEALSDAGFTVATQVRSVDQPQDRAQTSRAAVQYAGWVVAAIVSVFLALSLVRPDPPGPITRYSVRVSQPFLTTQNSTRLAVARDGANIVYVTPGVGTTRQLAVRGRDQLDATLLPGTDAAASPFLSPDGQTVAYFTEAGIVRTAALGGAPPVTLVDSGFGGAGGVWGRDGYIYGQSPRGTSRFPIGGGAMEVVSHLDTAQGECGHFWPDVLPNGKGVVFSIAGFPCTDVDQYRIGVVDIETGEHQVVMGGVHAKYALSGHLLVVTADGTLLAAPFDQDRLEAGSAAAVLEGVNVRAIGVADIGITDDGTLMYVSGLALGGAQSNEAVWIDRDGRATSVDTTWRFESLGNAGWSLSPDDQRLAIKLNTDAGQDIYIKRLDTGPSSRLTFDPNEDIRPHWTPDGRSVSFISNRSGQYDLYIRRYDGTGAEELLLDLEVPVLEAVWSHDGEWLVIRTGGVAGQAGGRDVWAVRPGTDSVPTPLFTSEFDERGIALSPDARWLAFESNESGRNEIYVRPFPDVEGGKWQVSTRGGRSPVWAHSSRELFYLDADDNMTVAAILPSQDFEWTTETLFRVGSEHITSTNYAFFDISTDDQRFFMVRVPIGEVTEEELIVVENFFEELRQKVGK